MHRIPGGGGSDQDLRREAGLTDPRLATQHQDRGPTGTASLVPVLEPPVELTITPHQRIALAKEVEEPR